ncbi:MAG: DNA translocase FtsK [Anaerolineales bacterium]|nr:MAG: DNA translocase FtsK [Anaerolineales bacterium]
MTPPKTQNSPIREISSGQGYDGIVDEGAGCAVRFQRFLWDFVGIFLLAFALLTLIALFSLPTSGGTLLTLWRNFIRHAFGYGAILVALGSAVAGILVLRLHSSHSGVNGEPVASADRKIPWGRLIALEVAAFAALGLLTVIGGRLVGRAEQGLDGGFVGWGLADLMALGLRAIGLDRNLWGGIVFGVILLVCLLYGMGLVPALYKSLQKITTTKPPSPVVSEPVVSVAPSTAGAGASPMRAESKKRRTLVPTEFRKRLVAANEPAKNLPPPQRDEHLPSLDMLVKDQQDRPDERNINQTAGMIEKSLAEFGIPAKVVGYRVGPTVTQFAVEPGFLEKGSSDEEQANKIKVRVAQIAGLRRDLALALSAERLRIEAPVPGRPYVGIEVPNNRTSMVKLRSILETEAFYKVNSPLAIALGRDVSGLPVVADLSTMPHLLIAGTTGSGKSVCIAAITTCLVMNNTPDDLRLVMIDPKMVELIRFNGLPHLFGKVETDIQRILGVLRWVVAEMDRRYKLLEETHARNIDSYNRKVRRHKLVAPLPRVVVLLDELADLMMTAPDQTEPMLIRLAQLARATGIHLVVATQRPSTDVVTGLIKANFPARISFAVASSVDSRVILDTGGAESLLGHGDMLFMPPEVAAPVRVQGVMVSDSEVEKVITYWQTIHPLEQGVVPPWEDFLKEEAVLADRDELVKKAIEMLRGEKRTSASMLQRRLRIGYPRAARLMDELEEMGVVGPAQTGGREREVLLENDETEDE